MKIKAWDIVLNKTDNFEFRKGITSFVNPYSMLMLQNREDIANGVDYWHVDGISLVNAFNKSGLTKTKLERFSFDDSSIAPIVFSLVKQKNLSIALIGTKEAFIHNAVKAIEQKNDLKVDFARNGYFLNDEDRNKTISYLVNNKIDVVVCGMGTPYQEKFLMDLKHAGWDGYGFTCGGYLHQIASKEDYYPTFFDKLNIRWVYRIIDEPKLFKRYAFEYPKFFLKFRAYKKQF